MMPAGVKGLSAVAILVAFGVMADLFYARAKVSDVIPANSGRFS